MSDERHLTAGSILGVRDRYRHKFATLPVSRYYLNFGRSKFGRGFPYACALQGKFVEGLCCRSAIPAPIRSPDIAFFTDMVFLA